MDNCSLLRNILDLPDIHKSPIYERFHNTMCFVVEILRLGTCAEVKRLCWQRASSLHPWKIQNGAMKNPRKTYVLVIFERGMGV